MVKKADIIEGAKTFVHSFRSENMSRVSDRAIEVLLNPSTVWRLAREEQLGVRNLFLDYVSVIAGCVAVLRMGGMWYFGVEQRDGEIYQPTLLDMLMNGSYIIGLSLALAYILGVVIKRVGGRWGVIAPIESAVTLASYSLTPAWLGYGLAAIPQLSLLGLLSSFYSIYILVTGIEPMTGVSREHRWPYTLMCGVVFLLGVASAVLILEGMSPRTPTP
jgi:Yip1 domain